MCITSVPYLQTPIGLFSLLDEESKFPQGSDASFLEKITKNFGKRPQFDRLKGNQPVFIIHHYAGQVSAVAVEVLEIHVHCKMDSAVGWL